MIQKQASVYACKEQHYHILAHMHTIKIHTTL